MPMAEQELLALERHAALREAFTRLPGCCQQLIALLTDDPPMPYAQISAKLGIPVGSIGPRRRRCLEKLRRDPAIAVLIHPGAASVGTDLEGLLRRWEQQVRFAVHGPGCPVPPSPPRE